MLAVSLTAPAEGPTLATSTEAPLRQQTAAAAPPTTRAADTAHPPHVPAALSAATLPDRFDLDVPAESLDFDHAAIDALINDGQATLHVPGAGAVTLTLVTHGRRADTDFITASTDGLTSSLTRRDNRFYLTLATARESYRIEGDAAGTRLYRHSVLAQRTISHAIDYRHIP